MSSVVDMPRTVPHVEALTGLRARDVCQRLANRAHLLFLDSAQTSDLGRYSYLSAEPACWLTSHQGWVSENGRFLGVADPLLVLADRLAAFRAEPIAELPTFQGGAAGLFSYDLCHHFEVLPRPIYNDFCLPDMAVGIYDWVLAFDHQTDDAWLISTGYPESDADRRERRAKQRGEQVMRWLFGPAAQTRTDTAPTPSCAVAQNDIETPQFPIDGLAGFTSNFDRARYFKTAARAIEYTHAGDCFQVNIAQRLLSLARLAPLELYDRLRTRNPAPFAGFFDLGEHQVLSASPERFLRIEDCEVETRPIKGTRPRGKTLEEDKRLASELQASGKDRSENVMIVDLLRNDLGRVCEYGSVRVAALCRLESYQTVHHLVSEVRGRLKLDLEATDLLRAAFPGGSVTGAPKIRAMEIITELEQTSRGAYCGSLGYLGFDGSMDTNLLIRTIVQSGSWLHFAVGGGIVADSTPEREYEETWHKAAGLLRALVD